MAGNNYPTFPVYKIVDGEIKTMNADSRQLKILRGKGWLTSKPNLEDEKKKVDPVVQKTTVKTTVKKD